MSEERNWIQSYAAVGATLNAQGRWDLMAWLIDTDNLNRNDAPEFAEARRICGGILDALDEMMTTPDILGWDSIDLPTPGGRLDWSNFTHERSFDLTGDDWKWVQQGGIAVLPSANLLVMGKGAHIVHPADGSFGTVAYDIKARMTAICPDPPNGWHFGGMCYEPESGLLWATLKAFYNTSGKDLASVCAINPDDLTNVLGPWRVGPTGQRWSCEEIGGNLDCQDWIEPKNFIKFHANKTHGYVTRIGPTWRDQKFSEEYALAGGRQRGAGAFGGAQGPSLYAFTADASMSFGGDQLGVPLMVYPTDAGYWPAYRNPNSYRVEWVETADGRGVVLVLAVEGTGVQYYGPGPAGTPYANRKGWHAPPYHFRIYLIDPEEIAKVVRGEQRPWDVQPFQMIEDPPFMWYGPHFPNFVHGAFEGAAWDRENSTLYLQETKVLHGEDDANNHCRIHVIKVT